MPTHFGMVKEFHLTYGLPIRTEPKIPEEKEVTLRIDLDEEELEEYAEADGENDLVEVADALTDFLYVIYGQGLVYGINLDRSYVQIPEINPHLPSETLRDSYIRLLEKNMENLIDAHVKGINEVKIQLDATLDNIYWVGQQYGIDLDACFKEVHRSNMSKLGTDGKPIYRADGKVLKGPNFTPPDLKRVLNISSDETTEVK